ncbi:hypothetical protein Hanom_Chr08g00701381 [Helianthus anomalus]
MTMICWYQNHNHNAIIKHSNLHDKRNPDHGYNTLQLLQNDSANLFYRADSTYLYIPCDGKVHTANKPPSRHERVWMCEVCEQAPATVTCRLRAFCHFDLAD